MPPFWHGLRAQSSHQYVVDSHQSVVDSVVDSDQSLVVGVGLVEYVVDVLGSADLLSHFTKVKCDYWT